MLRAMYAYPARGLLIIENTEIDYLGPTSNYRCATAGRKVHVALDVKDYFRCNQNSHDNHCGFPKCATTGVVDVHREGFTWKATKTDVWKTDGKFVVDEKRWVDWSVPVLP